ncbi:MAG TPA: hypothetical protein DCE11_01030 [Ruminiclostridium sp.]|jgi:hypothetical protein|nr:family 10 glycosylhydrolase [Clostridiaceae bacterium]HAA24689.1 hypothetical protein [Ruminiclostridium sp.]
MENDKNGNTEEIKSTDGQESHVNESEQENGSKKSILPVLLTIAVVLSLSLLGYFAWKTGQNQPNPGIDPQDYASLTPTSVPTNAPTEAPALTPTDVPAQEPSPEPSPEPTVTPKPTPLPKLEFKPVKALYLPPGSVQNSEKIDHYIELANRTEINAYVIDIKGDGGMVMYKSEIDIVKEADICVKYLDLAKLIKKFHDNNIRVIGRLVAFKDTKMAAHKPEWAIRNNGEIFKQPESSGYSLWLDATNRETWEYIADIVEEAISFGIDEIQFDYVRFPETSLYEYQLTNIDEGKERREYIEEFLAYVRSRVPEGTILSADIFGMPMISSRDYGEIGQTLESIGKDLDYISPMIYPSHYANDAPRGVMSNKVGQVINGVKFTHPDLKPYEVVYNTLIVGKKRIEAIEGYNLKCRPYIQGFTASYLPDGYWMEYGVEQYRAQIQAVYDAGYEEWIFWNARSEYVEEAFLPESEE